MQSNTIVDVGQGETLTATTTGGNPSNNIFAFYYSPGSSGGNDIIPVCGLVTSTNTATCTFTQTFQGPQPYAVGVTSGSQTANSPRVSVNVVNVIAPSVTISPAAPRLIQDR